MGYKRKISFLELEKGHDSVEKVEGFTIADSICAGALAISNVACAGGAFKVSNLRCAGAIKITTVAPGTSKG